MAVKKNYQDNNEIDLLKILKKWWSLRKFVFFQTIIVCLISTFILIIADKAFINKTQKYVTAVIKSDLGNKNSLIYAAYKSQPYILETLKRLSLDIDPNELLRYLIIEESTDPLTENLKDQILSADERKLKSLALTNEELSKIMEDLKVLSEKEQWESGMNYLMKKFQDTFIRIYQAI